MPNELSRKRRQLRGVGAFLVAALTACALAFTWQVVREHRAVESRVENSRVMLRHMSRLAFELSNLETRHREYLLIGGPTPRRLYDRAVTDLRQEITNLRAMAAADKEHQATLHEIETLSDRRVGDLGSVISLKDGTSSDAALRLLASEAVAGTTDRLQSAVESIRASELQQQAGLEESHRRHARILRGLTSISLAVAIVAIAAVFWLTRWIKRLQVGLVTMCAWTRTVQHGGKWVSVEDYLAQRFGIKVSHGICEQKAQELGAGLRKQDGPPGDRN